jgi:hypothetical protein
MQRAASKSVLLEISLFRRPTRIGNDPRGALYVGTNEILYFISQTAGKDNLMQQDIEQMRQRVSATIIELVHCGGADASTVYESLVEDFPQVFNGFPKQR